ncbi:MAG: Gfo/Idh/MocA family oxidoreductase [Lewinellaceae bacterium]|nr:Gfo/Idh/MocA family oxidoreductase [Saprospiraceae bacterium]MCB9336758.1 Gfo/Idh/MocA family oxidoreductase [Lewinellaceae bacterium]
MSTSKQKKQTPHLTRRDFVKTAGLTAAGFMIVPRHVIGRGYTPPSDKVNIAGIGVGGRGASVLDELKSQNIVALCDVDDVRAAETYKKFDKAKRYKDYRKMLDQQKDFDAVVIATPDHSHAPAALSAMSLGKHVYVEKPLTHSISEARALTAAAAQFKVVTQMGNQGSSGDGIRETQEIIDAGIIGDVTKVHVWTNRPVWPQGVPTPTGDFEVPTSLDWNLWLGTAPDRKYNPNYLPFKWRGWWDFGTGALGDMGCHFLDTPFKALRLKYPYAAEASCTQVFSGDFFEADYPDSCPPSSKVHIFFPARGEMPPVEVVWYDGGLLPERPEELGANEEMGEWDGGIIFEGSKGKLMCGLFGNKPTLLPTSKMKDFQKPEPTIPRIKETHQMNWVKGITDGTPTTSSFDYAGPFTEMVLMGNLAVRCYNMKKLKFGKKPGDWAPYEYPGRLRLLWDGDNMRITNFDPANEFVKREYRKF